MLFWTRGVCNRNARGNSQTKESGQSKGGSRARRKSSPFSWHFRGRAGYFCCMLLQSDAGMQLTQRIEVSRFLRN